MLFNLIKTEIIVYYRKQLIVLLYFQLLIYLARPLENINFWLINFNNSEAKAVVLEVLMVLSRVVGQVNVCYEGMFTPPSSSLSVSHSTNDFNVFCISKFNFCGIVVVFQLIQHCNSNMALEWPFEVVIKLSSHQVGKH